MQIISSKTDIVTYVRDAHADFVAQGLAGELADAIQDADHPAYGEDWSEWLAANVGALRDAVSLTDEQIKAAMAGFAAGGDAGAVELCERALDGDSEARREAAELIAYSAGNMRG
jgi:hypothetical protein